MNATDEFEYQGYRVSIDVREISGEIDSGVYVSTIAYRPSQSDAQAQWRYLEKNHQSIHLSAASARNAAMDRARKALDKL